MRAPATRAVAASPLRQADLAVFAARRRRLDRVVLGELALDDEVTRVAERRHELVKSVAHEARNARHEVHAAQRRALLTRRAAALTEQHVTSVLVEEQLLKVAADVRLAWRHAIAVGVRRHRLGGDARGLRLLARDVAQQVLEGVDQ